MIYDNDGNEVRCNVNSTVSPDLQESKFLSISFLYRTTFVSYVFAAANGKTYTSFFSLAVFPEDTRASNTEIRRTFA